MGDEIAVQCPWCFEHVTIWVERDLAGSLVQDCEVCCRPWAVFVWWDDERPFATVERAQ